MHETNICGGLAVGNDEVASITEAMYNLQYKLQDRLGKLPLSTASLQDRITAIIYWRHCIHTELDELLEWFEKEDDTSVDSSKEIEMELIDVLHFVFNIAITAELPINEVATRVETQMWPRYKTYELAYIHGVILTISKAISDYIDLYPWKSWKTYASTKVDKDDAVKKFAVILMELFNLAGLLGMSEKRVYNTYVAKNKENHARQDRGY